jgi:hypothetical protein
LDNRFSECIKNLERTLKLQQEILKNYMPKWFDYQIFL